MSKLHSDVSRFMDTMAGVADSEDSEDSGEDLYEDEGFGMHHSMFAIQRSDHFLEDEDEDSPRVTQPSTVLRNGDEDYFNELIEGICSSAKERDARDRAAKIRSSSTPIQHRQDWNEPDDTLIDQGNLPGLEDLLIFSVHVKVCFFLICFPFLKALSDPS